MIIEENKLLAPFTTFHIGGPARYFVEAREDGEVHEASLFARAHNVPLIVLGGGSNVLVADRGVDALVLRMVSKNISWNDEGEFVQVVADAGVSWDALVEECVSRGYFGIENLSAIPGSVGASVVQNIGAYGVEVSTVVEWVEVYDTALHQVRRLDDLECHFGYRASIFKKPEGAHLIVLRVCYRLFKNGTLNMHYKDIISYNATVLPIDSLQTMREAICTIRGRKFPDTNIYGTAGSFFKNPIVEASIAQHFLGQYPDAPQYMEHDGHIKLSAAWILDHVLHVRGVKVGAVSTWEGQALVILAERGARAEEVFQFARQLTERCFEKTQIMLEPEVVMVGNVAEE